MLDAYRAELLKLAEKSHEQYDKQVSFISSAGIGATMFLVDKLFPAFHSTMCKGFVIGGWCCLAVTLLGNLVSHTVAGTFHHRTAAEIENETYDQGKAAQRNRRISLINHVTTILLFVGVLLIILFVSINLIHGKGTDSIPR